MVEDVEGFAFLVGLDASGGDCSHKLDDLLSHSAWRGSDDVTYIIRNSELDTIHESLPISLSDHFSMFSAADLKLGIGATHAVLQMDCFVFASPRVANLRVYNHPWYLPKLWN